MFVKNILIFLLLGLSSQIFANKDLDCETALKIIPTQLQFEVGDNGIDYIYTTTHHKKNLKCELIPNGLEFKSLFAVTTNIEKVNTGEMVQYQSVSFKMVNKQIIYQKTHINNFPMILKAHIFDENTSHTWVMLNSGFIVRVNGTYQQ